MQTKRHSAEQGRTIIETLAYIMIMITITASIATVVSRGYYRYECSAIQEDLADLHKAIAKHYAIDGQYAAVKWDDLCEDYLGPKNMMPTRVCQTDADGKEKCKCKNQKGRHIFDGSVFIGPDNCEDGYCSTFFIQFTDLPHDICAQLGTKNWTTLAGSDLERLKINSTTWRWKYSPIQTEAGAHVYDLPVTVDSVSKACHEGYDNKITWTFN